MSVSRRNFLKSSGLLATAGIFGFTQNTAVKPKLSFSTLGCPDWTLDRIITFASAHKYDGIEFRGILRELDLTRTPAFANARAIRETVKKIKDKGLSIASLDTSAELHHKEKTGRAKAIDEAKRVIELAHDAGAPHIRVFPNRLPKEVPKEETIQLISAGLSGLGGFAKGTGVRVLMETHGDLVHVSDIEAVMSTADHQENIGLVWDVSNMWNDTRETPALVYSKISKWIRHIHLKDLRMVDGKAAYTLFGEGTVPVFEAIGLLIKNNFSGFYSFEWEKLWHPEILEPEIAIAQFSEKMHQYLSAKM
jgi:sugar phosphate isomerase/epimerase